jgi:hypothetical protein
VTELDRPGFEATHGSNRRTDIFVLGCAAGRVLFVLGCAAGCVLFVLGCAAGCVLFEQKYSIFYFL